VSGAASGAALPSGEATGPRALPSSRLPPWLRVGIPSGGNVRRVAELLGRRGLATVCDSARCPNKAECWGAATATFMVLGSVCTRGCRFCAVEHGAAGEAPRPEEPQETSGPRVLEDAIFFMSSRSIFLATMQTGPSWPYRSFSAFGSMSSYQLRLINWFTALFVKLVVLTSKSKLYFPR
jgi:hypothetical protein